MHVVGGREGERERERETDVCTPLNSTYTYTLPTNICTYINYTSNGHTEHKSTNRLVSSLVCCTDEEDSGCVCVPRRVQWRSKVGRSTLQQWHSLKVACGMGSRQVKIHIPIPA